LAIIFIFIIASRIACRQHYMHILDAYGHAYGLIHYEPLKSLPHPMGYLYYTACGKALNLLIGEPMLALEVLSILGSLATAIAFFALMRRFIDDGKALLATAVWSANPVFWYYGCVPMTYTIYSLLALLVGWFVIPKEEEEKEKTRGRWFMWSCIIWGLGTGFRYDSILSLGPTILLAGILRKPKWRYIMLGVLGGGIAFATWYIWVHLSAGGFAVYNAYASRYARLVLESGSIFAGITSRAFLSNLGRVVGWFICAVSGLWLIVPSALIPPRGSLHGEGKKLLLMFAWVGIPMLLFLIHVGAVGYMLALTPGIYIMVIWLVFKRPHFQRYGYIWLTIILALNLALFLFPKPLELKLEEEPQGLNLGRLNRLFLDYNWGALKQYDRSADALKKLITDNFTPDDVVILAVNTLRARNSEVSGFVGYHLPQYPLVIFGNIPHPEIAGDLRPLDAPYQVFPTEQLDVPPSKTMNYLLTAEGPLKPTNFEGVEVVEEHYFEGRYFCRWLRSNLSVRELYLRIADAWNE